MSERTTVGTCSICRGRVSVPTFWMGVIPPTPTCESCGAIPAQPHGEVIPMAPNPVKITTAFTNRKAER